MRPAAIIRVECARGRRKGQRRVVHVEVGHSGRGRDEGSMINATGAGLHPHRDGAHPVIVLFTEELGAVFADFAPGGEIVGRELAFLERDHLGQVLAQQAKGPAHRDDVHGDEELVQHQHACVQSGVECRYHIPFHCATRGNGTSFLILSTVVW